MNTDIGTQAGAVWNLLYQKGPQTVAQLKKEVDANDFMAFAAVGWLAREGKVEVKPSGKSFLVSLA